MPSTATTSKPELRKMLRARRRALNIHTQKLAGVKLARQLRRLPVLHKARHIAAYWPADGEISPLPFLLELQRQGKKIYLPQVLGSGQLGFRRYHISASLSKNVYGIPEPLSREQRFPQDLDIVLMPLVGFDHHGNRLGMGGGYYDKTFAFLHKSLWRCKPLLIGLAHHCQQVDALPADAWDIPLCAIVTDRSII